MCVEKSYICCWIQNCEGRFSSHHYVEQCVLCFWERMSASSCAFTFKKVSFLVPPCGTLSCLTLIIVN